jgi:hypothetical protein
MSDWFLWSTPEGILSPPRAVRRLPKPRQGQTLEHSGDGSWATLYAKGEPVRVYLRLPKSERKAVKPHPARRAS